jgi:hypothetical protein
MGTHHPTARRNTMIIAVQTTTYIDVEADERDAPLAEGVAKAFSKQLGGFTEGFTEGHVLGANLLYWRTMGPRELFPEPVIG